MHLRLSLASAVAAAALLAASAHAAVPPKPIVTSTASGGMIYAGVDTAESVEFRPIAGPKFIVDASVAIAPGAGCTADAADATKATCIAFKRPDGTLKEFHAFGRKGNDTIRNFSGATMVARGEDGEDDLSGGSGPDTLLGGPGNRDDLRGNSGPDILNGGPGEHDGVSYSNRDSATDVSIDDTVANDGRLGENDQVLEVEDVVGGNGDDVIEGNASDNVIVTGPGEDSLVGGLGADTLLGGDDGDVLSTGQSLPGLPFSDGAVDKLSGDGLFGGEDPGPHDTCFFSVLDPDTPISCEIEKAGV
jgi:hypothetical protein